MRVDKIFEVAAAFFSRLVLEAADIAFNHPVQFFSALTRRLFANSSSLDFSAVSCRAARMMSGIP